MQSVTLSICICTSGRPLELARCLESIQTGTRLPDEVIVSDDSRDAAMSKSIMDVAESFMFAKYINGPKKGLCPNRNHVIRKSLGDYVSLLDDDAVVSPLFVEGVLQSIAANPGTIITGDILEGGTKKVTPSNPTYLGHFGRAVEGSELLANINLNCNAFPRSAFSVAEFDESIQYGYEDMDVCAQLMSAGFRIVYIETLYNLHLPPDSTLSRPGRRLHLTERARLYTSMKRYFIWKKQPAMGLTYIAVAPAHLFLSGVRRYGIASGISFLRDAFWAVREMSRFYFSQRGGIQSK